jgi:hypothetical protein
VNDLERYWPLPFLPIAQRRQSQGWSTVMHEPHLSSNIQRDSLIITVAKCAPRMTVSSAGESRPTKQQSLKYQPKH